jgi:uroporphyrin-3 C-methyltransferase
MNDKQNDLETTEDAEFEVEDRTGTDPQVEPQVAHKARGNGVAWLAVLVSLLALAAVGYTLFMDWRSAGDAIELDSVADVESLQQRIDEFDLLLASLDTKIADIPRPDYSGDLDAVRRDVDEQIRLLNSLPARMSTIENSVASLAGISAGARETFLLAEGEYYLQIANAQLQLANNPHLATLAMGMADERITQLSDPALTDVRRAIADELAALEVMDKPDLEGATLTLASLASVVESLPLAGGLVDGERAVNEENIDASAADRAWSSVKDAISGLVKVTPPDQAKLALVTPDAEYFLRSNIALQLQAARLALLRGEQRIFEAALDDTSALLESYFDIESTQVQSAQQTIAEIRSSVVTTAMPDISASLRLLRQYRTLRENNE